VLADHAPSSTRVTSHTPLSWGSVLISNPDSRHIFNMTEFSWRIWPSILFRACGFGVLDYQLHQGPAQASALKVRSQQDRVLAGFTARVVVETDDADRLMTGFIDGNKGQRARIIELRQASDKFMRKFLDGIEKAKPQIFIAHMCQKVANQEIIVRSNRANKYPPVIPENEMSLPL